MSQAGSHLDPDEGIRIVDVIDRLLDRGVVLRGEIWLTVAGVELLFIGADLVIASPDTIAAGHAGLEHPT